MKTRGLFWGRRCMKWTGELGDTTFDERNRNLPEGAFEIPKAEMDRYITIFQPPTGDELV